MTKKKVAKKKNYRTKDKILRDRMMIAQLMLKGKLQFEVAKALKLDKAIISREVASIRKEWQSSAVRDFDKEKGLKLAELDYLKKEAWEAWEKSKKELKIKTVKDRETPSGGNELAKAFENSVRTENREGDIAYFNGILKCIDLQREILGFKKRIELSGDLALKVTGFEYLVPDDEETPENSD